MKTIEIEIDDEVYEDIVDSGINIQKTFENMIRNILDDGYPSVSTQEAKKRVSSAIERYESKKGTYSPYDSSFAKRINQYIDQE